VVRKGPEEVGTIIVRFLDDEIMVGRPERLSLDEPDFVLQLSDASGNNERALVPLASIKRVTFQAHPPTRGELGKAERKVAIRFQDGEVLKGYLYGDLEHARYGLTMQLVTVEKDRFEKLGIPYSAIKALFYVRSWDSRPPEFGGKVDEYVSQRLTSPLVDLLADIQKLAKLREKGAISDIEFQRKRKKILDNI